jgi:hypothetical protein
MREFRTVLQVGMEETGWRAPVAEGDRTRAGLMEETLRLICETPRLELAVGGAA